MEYFCAFILSKLLPENQQQMEHLKLLIVTENISDIVCELSFTAVYLDSGLTECPFKRAKIMRLRELILLLLDHKIDTDDSHGDSCASHES